MKEINLSKFKQGIKGRKFSELIKHHINRQNKNQLQMGCMGTINLLDKRIKPHMMEFIDKWNLQAYNKEFYNSDCLDVFNEISSDAKKLLKKLNCNADDETLFNIFQIIILSYAYSASDQPKMREFMGTQRTFRFGSASVNDHRITPF